MDYKKYEILKDDSITFDGVKMYRIKALKKFIAAGSSIINKGDLGGYIEGYHNLSQEGICWVCGSAKVYGNARVKGDSIINNEAHVSDNAVVCGKSWVSCASVYGNAVISDSEVMGTGKCPSFIICGNVKVDRSIAVGNVFIFSGNEVFYNYVNVFP
jgi:hypothetical protein